MATKIPSQVELLELFKNEVQSRAPTLTDFEEGSINDAIGGGISVGGEELSKIIIDKFNKTFFETSSGPEITGGPDDLQTLAKDHFGEGFARPKAKFATATINFTRPNTDAGDVVIPNTIIVKTVKDANGEEQRFKVVTEVTMTGTSIDASVLAVVAGIEGNANSGTITVIESSLTDDSVVATNALAAVGGEAVATDAAYREFIRNKVEIIRGATKEAIEASAKNVSGIETATAIEDLQTVIEFDIGPSETVGSFFSIPRVRLFVADVNGVASAALLALVRTAIDVVRACGVKIDILAATPLSQNWTATLTLNPSGPNFDLLSTDTTIVTNEMEQFIRDLPIGTGFNRASGRTAILAIFGSTGTDDLTDFTTSIPAGDVSASITQKLIPGTVATT